MPPELRAAFDNYGDQGFEVLSVSIQEEDAEVGDFINTYGGASGLSGVG